MYHILVVDSDGPTTHRVGRLLGAESYTVTTLTSAIQALHAVNDGALFDVIVLDIVMPDMDGIALCQHIRAISPVPIIFLSALGDPTVKLAGFRAGADDYITKPFEPIEMLARVWAVIRRTQPVPTDEAQLRTPDMVLAPTEPKVTLLRNGSIIHLTPSEHQLLRCLLSNAGRSLMRESLMMKVWGDQNERESNQLDASIQRLRAKIEENPSQPQMLLTVSEIGYKYRPGGSTPL